MAKILKVNCPLLGIDDDDELILNEAGTEYTTSTSYEFNDSDDKNSFYCRANTEFSISKEYAEKLVKDGCLIEVKDKDVENKPFVNIFDEIDALLNDYNYQLTNIDKDCKDCPECLKLEKKTVLTNLTTVLNHLKNLKK